MKKILENFPYLTQIDNKLFSSTSCYPTSMAMAIWWCLKQIGKDETAIGCPPGIQVEDYITAITESKETKLWIKNNVSKYGSWLLNYKPRTLAYVEEMIFNKLMNPFGFKTEFSSTIMYEFLVNHINTNNMPIVIHGDFSSISTVSGHIVCAIGYNIDAKTVFVQDPFGNALVDKYRSHDFGKQAEYYKSLLIKDKKNDRMWGQIISKL